LINFDSSISNPTNKCIIGSIRAGIKGEARETLPVAEGNRAKFKNAPAPFDPLATRELALSEMGFGQPDSYTVPPTAWSRRVFAIPRTLDIGDVLSANRPDLAK
jgi:hypothetical protein